MPSRPWGGGNRVVEQRDKKQTGNRKKNQGRENRRKEEGERTTDKGRGDCDAKLKLRMGSWNVFEFVRHGKIAKARNCRSSEVNAT